MRAMSRRGQRGLTLIEFMVSVVIGMLMIAALATLIANQSQSRGEVDRAGKMLENGRYALTSIAKDAEMAGYWGEFATAPAVPTPTATAFNGTVLDPCATAVASLQSAAGVPVQGYNFDSAEFPTCISNRRSGTDVLVIRRLEPDMTEHLTGGLVDLSKLTVGQIYMQTGLNAAGTAVNATVGQASDAATNATTFPDTRRDGSVGNTRKYLVHIYYVSSCSVEVAGSCAGADGGTPIPTLKRVELSNAGGAPAMRTITIAEGIEDLQVDFGHDTDADGVPNTDVNGSGLTAQNWSEIMGLKIYMLARAAEVTPGFTDDKTYMLGTKGAASAAADERGYKRHMFVQTVRLVNPAGRLKV